VVDTAAGDRLPSVAALAEAFRRRRAAGGPAEQTFAALVGLELRPRRLREAVALWAAVTEHRGIQGRDALWGHPDLLPTDEDFANPEVFAQSKLDWDISELDGLDGDK
jgi:putative hydrolase